MRCIEEITATGGGQWGNRHYDISLVTVTCSWMDEPGHHTASVATYDLRCSLSTDGVDVRSFPSEEEREAFLAQGFTGVRLASPSHDGAVVRERPHPLQPIVGEPLSAVIFVMDYLQLQFAIERLTGYVWPLVQGERGTVRFEAPGYRDALCSLIGSIVEKVDEYLDLGLVVTFDGGQRLIFPLKVEGDFFGPELLEFGTHVWFQGAEPFV